MVHVCYGQNCDISVTGIQMNVCIRVSTSRLYEPKRQHIGLFLLLRMCGSTGLVSSVASRSICDWSACVLQDGKFQTNWTTRHLIVIDSSGDFGTDFKLILDVIYQTLFIV